MLLFALQIAERYAVHPFFHFFIEHIMPFKDGEVKG